MTFKKLYLFLFISLSSFSGLSATPTLTVFVHGTVLWWSAFASPSWFVDGHVDQASWYATILNTGRDDPDLYERSMMLEKGFKEIPNSLIEAACKGNLSADRSRFGAYYMIAGYDAIARACGYASEEDYYALFGWSGMNSHSARFAEGLNLYRAIADWSDAYEQKHGKKPAVKINAYSHGGNVVLNMAKAEEIYQRGLSIKQLSLFATPMQFETRHFIESPFFKSIVLFRSPEGDDIQTIDSFSTITGESYATMDEIEDLRNFKHLHPNLHRVDVGLWINKDSKAVDHFNLFELDAGALHEELAPLPVVVLAPMLLEQINQHEPHIALRARILCNEDFVKTQIKSAYDFYDGPLSESDNMYDIVAQVKHCAESLWKPKKQKLSSRISRAYEKATGAFARLDIFSDDD